MEVLIDYLGELAPEAAYLYEIVDAGTQNPLQAAELLQQLASFHRPQARNGFEYRLAMAFRPLAPVSGDRESMRLVAHALDQVQGRGVRRQDNRRVPARQEQLLLARAPVGALGDADQGDALDTELVEAPCSASASCPLPPSISSTSGAATSPSRTRL